MMKSLALCHQLWRIRASLEAEVGLSSQLSAGMEHLRNGANPVLIQHVECTSQDLA